jgi:hypothetical protein
MVKVKASITRERLYENIYEPCEKSNIGSEVKEDVGEFYNAAAKLLVKMYLAEGEVS